MLDTYENAQCPYCRELLYINFRGKDRELHEDELYVEECPHCGKNFVYEIYISFHCDTYKADCQNEDGEHDWKITKTFPAVASEMVCSMCGERRQLTIEEWEKILETYDLTREGREYIKVRIKYMKEKL